MRSLLKCDFDLQNTHGLFSFRAVALRRIGGRAGPTQFRTMNAQPLTPEGEKIAGDLARRHGFSVDAVTHMMRAVLNGTGSLAQFAHPEFGGSGQWMRGGMIMLGDMFNNGLKNRVDSLCTEISGIPGIQPFLQGGGSFQSQSQGGYASQMQAGGGTPWQSSLFVPDPASNWWPQDLGAPNATGSQNSVRYAYFGGARRLAVQSGSDVWVYDTLDHQIGGFSQQQGQGGAHLFTSQYGTVNLNSLPLVSQNGQPCTKTPPQSNAPAAPEVTTAPVATTPAVPPIAPIAQTQVVAPPASTLTSAPAAQFTPATPVAPAAPSVGIQPGDIISTIERLAALKTQGILTEAEFSAKKTELLSRL